MIHIWHYTGIVQPQTIEQAISRFDLYQKVARISVYDLNQAYYLTQNIDNDWTENSLVDTLVDRCRSTMVGDIFMFRGTMYMVDQIGFTEMPNQ
jgi:hypothetical protein